MYTVVFYRGDYRDRQERANKGRCACYVEHHFNSSDSPGSNYTVVVTGANASPTSKNWGRWFAQAVAREFGIPVGGDDGIKVGGFDGRGDYNLKFTKMPALLLEPLFASNPQHAEWIRSAEGQSRLAQILAESIQRFFPAGGKVGFSVGHKYKTAQPDDRGAAVYGGGFEADYAEMVLGKAKTLVEAVKEIPREREIRVVMDDQVLWTRAIDPDARVAWDPVRGMLRIHRV